MHRAHKIALLYGVAVLLAFDTHAVAQRFLLATVEPVAWLKVVAAFVAQAIAVAALAIYLAILGKQDRAVPAASIRLSWRIKVLPIVGLGVLAAFSVAVLYNAVVCGNQSLPTVRGVPMCAR